MKTHPAPATDAAILAATLRALRNHGIEAEMRPAPDGSPQIHLRYGERSAIGSLQTRRQVTPTNLGLIAHQLAQLDSPLLVTGYVTPPVAEQLRKLNIEFADAAGNAFIQAPSLLIWVNGRKPERRPSQERLSRAFQPGGLKLIFALLCQPALAAAPYRTLAAAADVALGTVGWVMNDLKEAGFLREPDGGGRELVNRRKLTEQWAEGYARQLRPKTLIGRFRSHGGKPLKAMVAAGLLCGDAPASKTLTAYVPQQQATRPDLPETLGLTPDRAGEIELRRMFWHFELPDNGGTIPPLLAYADLLATAELANVEAARAIFDGQLASAFD